MRTFSLVFLLSSLVSVASAQVAILNGASNRVEQPISPGAWATAYGNFTGVTTTTASSFPLPKTLANVKVTVDGTDAPIYFVSPTQINFLVPYSTTPGVKPVTIANGGTNFTGSIRIITASPGLFVKDAATPPRGAIRNQDGISENSQTTPAKRGDIVSVYGTGPGALSSNPADGAAPGASPLITTKSTPQVFIGGVPATVQFSGLNPDAPGLWQINVVIPNQAFLTGRLPVRIYMDGVDSNEVTLFVQ